MVKNSELVRFFAKCCNTPICFSHRQAPSIAVLAANFDAKSRQRLGKPSKRIMTKHALKEPPSDPPVIAGFGLGLICLVLKFICCSCCYASERKANPVPYPDTPVLVKRVSQTAISKKQD
mmetsp:Transcript_23145/g.46425  ORF Transcript_23145/g.46425 Transcript_23145/m.46425 type:complete len:120 (-) Transcript_23145:141-500(-)